ncbi:MAG TPA: hypothetical protein VGM29_08380 [Polyangiaceae bacterium]|jgi:hypothetical protein
MAVISAWLGGVLVSALPHLMLTFLEQSCRKSRGKALTSAESPLSCSGPELIRALRDGRATPESLFDWATAEWSAEPPQLAWQAYLAREIAPLSQSPVSSIR